MMRESSTVRGVDAHLFLINAVTRNLQLFQTDGNYVPQTFPKYTCQTLTP